MFKLTINYIEKDGDDLSIGSKPQIFDEEFFDSYNDALIAKLEWDQYYYVDSTFIEEV